MFTPLTILLAILGISLLVVVHETGHYVAARAFGMRVLRYSIGFGQVLWRYQPKGSPTVFQVCAIPFLAYVQIDGMNPMERVEPDDPQLFANKSIVARIVTIGAGPFANYLLASVIVFGLTLTYGVPVPAEHPLSVGEVQPSSPAAEAGIRPGDVFLEANGKPVASVSKLIGVTAPRGGQETVYRLRRGEETLEVTLTPEATGEGEPARVGVAFGGVRRSAGMAEAIGIAIATPIDETVRTVERLSAIVNRGSLNGLQVSGPVGMTKMMAQSASLGPQYYLRLLYLISIALGFFNLLPVPALDGGRLVFLGYELITRRRANEKVEAAIHTVGLLFLLGVLVLVTYQDFLR